MGNDLNKIKAQKWFYEFELPDGTKTQSYVRDEVKGIHVTRAKALRHYLGRQGQKRYSTALDVACHEGFFAHILSSHVGSVVGVDKNADSLTKAIQITKAFGIGNIQFKGTAVEDLGAEHAVDFVLCYGLLYHVENPVRILRALSVLAKKAVCIETQVLPFETSAKIEDGSYLVQRDLKGLFGLCEDYSQRKEGGLTDFALVPSTDGLLFLLKKFGFSRAELYRPSADDYEQFVRGQRVIIFAEK